MMTRIVDRRVGSCEMRCQEMVVIECECGKDRLAAVERVVARPKLSDKLGI